MKKKYIEKIKILLRNILSIVIYIFRIFPINKKKILFSNFGGKGYGDNPKYLAEYIHNQDSTLSFVWIVNNYYDNIPNYITQVKKNSIRWFYEIATAKIWINNSRFSLFVKKRKKQFYIQTWHGGLALKKVEFDSNDKFGEYYQKVMINDNKMIDAMISNSTFCTNMYKTSFRFNGNILEYGTPRNDVIINHKKELSKNVYESLKINNDVKILLYAPTFRKDYSNNPYDINFKKLKKVLEDKTGNNWEIIVKLHPSITDSKTILKSSNEYIDVSNMLDIQELICGCDILITDYSSTMFEAMIADKNVIIYAKDIKEYNNERGYYFKFNELPFPLTTNNDELINLIKTNDLDTMKKSYFDFKKRVGLIENGDACKKVYNLIKEQMR